MAILNSILTWRMKKRFHQIELFMKYPLEVQKECFDNLIEAGSETIFGKEHDFDKIKTIRDFQNAVPVRQYEQLQPYISKVMDGEKKVLWNTPIKWFAKSSGTTNDKAKHIPVSAEALYDCHYKGGKDMLSLYCQQNHDTHIFTGKTITMGGSHQILADGKGAYSGDLSAILIDNLPFWVSHFRAPEKEIILMGNWEEKIEKMANKTIGENITSISGVPSWTLVLFNRILEITGAKSLQEVWPNLELYMHGGVRFDPYHQQFQQLAPKLKYFETYNASEGFFGIQHRMDVKDFLLMLDYGIFYEFIPMSEFDDDNHKTLTLGEVEIGVNYAMVISTNAGLWRYLIGDTVMFTSLDPFKIKITGRTKAFINAFGEELIVDNTEEALYIVCHQHNAIIKEYTAGPIYLNEGANGAHEWLIEFEQAPNNIEAFRNDLDQNLKSLNGDYEAKRFNDMILGPPQLNIVPNGTFYDWLKSKNKIGGQHKIPRLANHRKFIEEIKALLAHD